MAKIISFANQKGGVGKTTSCVNVAASLGLLGHRVLLIDLDPQGNTTSGVGVTKRGLKGTTKELLNGEMNVKDIIRETPYENLSVIPANTTLTSSEFELFDFDENEYRMKKALAEVKGDFDYILIDCPAGAGSGLELAIAGADRALIVTEADMAALRDADILNRYLKKSGITNTCYIVNKVRADLMERKVIPDLNEVTEIMSSKLIGVIQFDDNIYISTNRGVPIVFKEGTYIEQNFRNIERRFIECGQE